MNSEDRLSCKVLIVDDNEKNLKLLAEIIRHMGHEPVCATNGGDGIRIAREQLPGLILMDIQMPVIDGITAMKILKADPLTRHMHIIAVTSCSMVENMEKFLQEGFDNYMLKPIVISSLMNMVEAALTRQA